MSRQKAGERTVLELEQLGKEIRSLRGQSRYLRLPDDLKIRLCRLRKAGVSFGQIKRETGVQAVSIASWMKLVGKTDTYRPFQVLAVEESKSKETLVFRYGEGKVTLEVKVSQLNSELLKVLTSC